ncbi:hypothetical protein ACROYT_G030573 [Oculina patagonica]
MLHIEKKTSCHLNKQSLDKRMINHAFSGTLPMVIKVATVASRNRQNHSKKQEEFRQIMNEIVKDYIAINDISTQEGLAAFYSHLTGALSVHIKQIKSSSLILVVQCRTFGNLERLWTDYCSGHLNEVAEKCLVTERIKRKFGIESLTLKTTILEEDYWACRRSFRKNLQATKSYSAGLRVVSGPSWNVDASDGEEGFVGTVVELGGDSSSVPENMALVQWDTAICQLHRAGHHDAFDLCVLDSSPVGVKHVSVACISCKQTPILGTCWSCLDCKDHAVNLCTSCYMADEHDIQHAFQRKDSPFVDGISVGRRSKTRKIQARGIYPGAKVTRGPDWEYGNQDGGVGSFGTVKKITNWKEKPACAAVVSWESGTEATYRLGYHGKVDLQCVRASNGGYYYKAHLPILDQASRSDFHKASISGRYETVKKLLESGEDVDQTDMFSLTPLHLAAWYGHESVARLLLEHGANVNAVDRLSLKSLSRKAFMHVDRRSGFNLLQAAVIEGKYKTVWKAHGLLGNYIKELNFEKTGSNAKHFPGKTAVDILASLEKKEKGHAAIEKFYKESVLKHDSLAELHVCNCNDDAEKAVELVLNEGVDINIPAKSNRTPLLWASPSSSSQFIKTLIDLGADVNVQRADEKVAPLPLAAYWNNYMASRILLEYGADKNIQNESGDTPLLDSARAGHFTVSQLLIESGCNLNLQNNADKTPLYVAVENKREHLVKLLLESKADVNMRFKQNPKERLYLVRGKDKGRSAWHYVMVEKPLLGLFLKQTQGGSLDVADFGTVLKSGWGENPPERVRQEIDNKERALYKELQGNTLLHLTSENNDTELMELLVKHGADVNSRDAEGFTPLHVAVIRGKIKVVKKLVELKADVNLATTDGKDAADLAELNEETEIAEYLQSKRRNGEGLVKNKATSKLSFIGTLSPVSLQQLKSLKTYGNYEWWSNCVKNHHASVLK